MALDTRGSHASQLTALFAALVCVLATAALARNARAQGAAGPPRATPTDQGAPSVSRPSAAAKAPDGKTRKILIGFHVNTIDEIDWRTSTFRGDLYWWILYPKPVTVDEQKYIEALEFANGEVENGPGKVQERKLLRDRDQIYISYRTIARFHFEADFRKYPFDRQRFPIVIEHEMLPATGLVFEDDIDSYVRSGAPKQLWGLGDSVHVPGLDVKRVVRDFSDHEYKTNFGDPEAGSATRFSRATLTIEVERRFAPYLVKIIIPLLIILLLAYLVFFVPAQQLEVAAGLTVTSVLSCIAVQFTLNVNMPDVGYIITSDRIFHLCYFLIMLAMAETVVTFNLEKTGKVELSKRIELWAKVLYPGAFLLGMLLILLDGLSG